MPRWLGRSLGVFVAAAVTVGIAALSRAPYDPYPGGDAMIRLAWSARPERIEQCRRQSDEELAKLPAHMRLRVVCEGTSARYQLEVRRDGQIAMVDTVRGTGVRHDRPLYLLREVRLLPGKVRLEVRFLRIDQPTAEPAAAPVVPDTTGAVLEQREHRENEERERREEEERERRYEEAVPPLLALDSTFRLDPRQVLLVTYDPTRRVLVAIAGQR